MTDDIIKRLREAIAADFERMIGTALTKDITALLDRLDAAERECERMREDAERYRFIRDADRSDPFLPIGSLLCYAMDDLDAAIDAAREAEK